MNMLEDIEKHYNHFAYVFLLSLKDKMYLGRLSKLWKNRTKDYER